MALYHFHVEQIKRSEGRTAVASAAYRAGEKLHNLWDGETHDYTKKGGVILSEIILPEYAPERFSNRYALWNEVDQIEIGEINGRCQEGIEKSERSLKVVGKKRGEVQVANFTAICTSFYYHDIKSYDKIYRDKVLRKIGENLVKPKKNEVLKGYRKI